MILINGMEDYTFFAAIYTLDPEDYQNPDTKAIDWDRLLRTPELIAKANPMYGVSLDPVKINLSVLHGHKLRPDKRGEIARNHLNRWPGPVMTLIGAAFWSFSSLHGLVYSRFIGRQY